MKFVKNKNDDSSIRKVYSDDNKTLYGIVGTVEDLLKAEIFTYVAFLESEKPAYAFISFNGKNVHFAKTRDEAIKYLKSESYK
ncbi:MAG: hypothetical protein GXY86_08125 [Firmicutes bacterium]|jgi:hypothetical protein|nr:hypothetical protein [Bacillota bacterium]